MRRRRLPGPEHLPRRSLGDDEEYVVYRVVLTDDTAHEAFLQSFQSRGERGLPPRRGTPEERHPSLNDGVSAFRTRSAAAGSAEAAIARGRGFGDFTAAIRLRGGCGIDIAEWGSPGHLTVWGDALILRDAATDIVRVTEPEAPRR
jgi:hypothetical protein